MTLEESIKNDFASYIGKECRFEDGLDWIEKVYITGKSFGGYEILTELKYAGRVPVTEVKLIKE